MDRPTEFLQQLFSLDYHCRTTTGDEKRDESSNEEETSQDDNDIDNFFEGENDDGPVSLDDPTTCSSGVLDCSTASNEFSPNLYDDNNFSFGNALGTMIPLHLAIPMFAIFDNVAKEESIVTSEKVETRLSNADVILCTLSACDPFLIQDVFEKMSLCQLAVPVIAQFEENLIFHLWASRNIKKQWTSLEESGKRKVLEGVATQVKLASISFCRIGETKMSKSKLANSFISSAHGGSEHPFFIHRDIDRESNLSKGSVEAVWYCPDGGQKSKVSDISCIYNLRGDVRDNR